MAIAVALCILYDVFRHVVAGKAPSHIGSITLGPVSAVAIATTHAVVNVPKHCGIRMVYALIPAIMAASYSLGLYWKHPMSTTSSSKQPVST